MYSWVSGQVLSACGKSHSTVTRSSPIRSSISKPAASSSAQNQKLRCSTSTGCSSSSVQPPVKSRYRKQCSTRSSSEGTPPTPPSEMAIRRPGKRSATFENSQSVVAMIEPTKNSAVVTSGGASEEPPTRDDAEPTCSDRVVSVSSQACRTGSQ